MADAKVSAMPAATAVADADLVPIVQSGVNKKAPASLLKGLKGDKGDKGDPGDPVALTPATAATLGGVKIGSGVSVAADGTISVQAGTGTDLGYTAATRLLTSSTGADVTLPEATDAVPGLMAAADKAQQAALSGFVGSPPPAAWTAKDYTAGSLVLHLNKIWAAERDAAAADVPGTAGKWHDVTLLKIADQAQAAFNHRVPDSAAGSQGQVLTITTAGQDPTWADPSIQISAMPAADIVGPTDLVPIVQGGVNKKAYAQRIGGGIYWQTVMNQVERWTAKAYAARSVVTYYDAAVGYILFMALEAVQATDVPNFMDVNGKWMPIFWDSSVQSFEIDKVRKLTQAEYDALPVKRASVLYVIVG